MDVQEHHQAEASCLDHVEEAKINTHIHAVLRSNQNAVKRITSQTSEQNIPSINTKIKEFIHEIPSSKEMNSYVNLQRLLVPKRTIT